MIEYPAGLRRGTCPRCPLIAPMTTLMVNDSLTNETETVRGLSLRHDALLASAALSICLSVCSYALVAVMTCIKRLYWSSLYLERKLRSLYPTRRSNRPKWLVRTRPQLTRRRLKSNSTFNSQSATAYSYRQNVYLSVRLCVRLSRAGIVSKQRMLGSCNLHYRLLL